MARNAVRLGVRELSEIAGVAPATVSRLEGGKGGINMRSADAIQTALEALGIQFLDPGDGAKGPGVALHSEAKDDE
ncbi:MAG: helix-turn-helix domain-containing protein [Shimia sp.]